MNNKGYRWYTEENWQDFLAFMEEQYKRVYSGTFLPVKQMQSNGLKGR